jgi:hypothetical protein
VIEKKSLRVAHDGKGASAAKRSIAKEPGNTVKPKRRLDSLMR